MEPDDFHHIVEANVAFTQALESRMPIACAIEESPQFGDRDHGFTEGGLFLPNSWGANQIGEVCDNPQTFMTSFQKLLDAHKGNGGISGLVIDWEKDGNTTPAKLDSFISLYRNTFPGLELRVCPDTFDQGLQDMTVTKKLDYLMPQSYQQWDPSLSRANQAISLIGAGKVIVGMESERRPQDPVITYVNYFKHNNCAGIFVWRLDNDDVDSHDFPRFTLAEALWPAINDSDTSLFLSIYTATNNSFVRMWH